MDLFEVTNNRAFPSTHALMIEPFKTIWESDPSPEKANAIKVFSYVELCLSPKKSNPYLGYNEDERPKIVKKELWGDSNKEDTNFMILASVKYRELLEKASPTYSLFNAALIAKDKLETYLQTFDLSERTQSGTAVMKPKDVTSALKDIPDTAKGIVAMREKVQAELLEDAKTRKDREIGLYER